MDVRLAEDTAEILAGQAADRLVLARLTKPEAGQTPATLRLVEPNATGFVALDTLPALLSRS